MVTAFLFTANFGCQLVNLCPSCHLATARASHSCLMLDYVHVINFLLIIIITYRYELFAQ